MQLNFTKYNQNEQEITKICGFQDSYLTQEQFEKGVEIIMKCKNAYATTKFDVGKTNVKLNLPMKKICYIQKQRKTKSRYTLEYESRNL